MAECSDLSDTPAPNRQDDQDDMMNAQANAPKAENLFVPLKKVLLLAALAVFVGHRLPLDWLTSLASPLAPAVDYDSLTPAQKELWQTIQPLRPEDKRICGDYFASLARAVAADPTDEPVFLDTPTLRRAWRAGFLCVWRGIADNKAGEYPGLSAALEAGMTEAIGVAAVPMNPSIRKSAVDYLNKVASLCTNGQR